MVAPKPAEVSDLIKTTPVMTLEPEEPWPEDFKVPANDDEMETMIEAMVSCGKGCQEAEMAIKARKKDYNDAIKKYKVELKIKKDST